MESECAEPPKEERVSHFVGSMVEFRVYNWLSFFRVYIPPVLKSSLRSSGEKRQPPQVSSTTQVGEPDVALTRLEKACGQPFSERTTVKLLPIVLGSAAAAQRKKSGLHQLKRLTYEPPARLCWCWVHFWARSSVLA